MAKEAKTVAPTTIEVTYQFVKDTPGTWRYDANVEKGERVPAGSVYLQKSTYPKKPTDTVVGTFTFTAGK